MTPAVQHHECPVQTLQTLQRSLGFRVKSPTTSRYVIHSELTKLLYDVVNCDTRQYNSLKTVPPWLPLYRRVLELSSHYQPILHHGFISGKEPIMSTQLIYQIYPRSFNKQLTHCNDIYFTNLDLATEMYNISYQ